MATLSLITAGESHGPGLTAIVSGVPAGVLFDLAFINGELARRQGGFGRSGRMGIEDDHIEVLAGVRKGVTTGAPVALFVKNKDSRLDDEKKTPAIHRPRPGHADLAGAIKFASNDCRDVVERASARETAARVAGCAVARCMLRELGIESFAFVRQIHAAATGVACSLDNWHALRTARDASETYCPDAAVTAQQRDAITNAKHAKDTVGGVIECHVFGVMPGIGSCMNAHEKLDGLIAGSVMSIQAIKSVEIGLGRDVAGRTGSNVHDAIGFDASQRNSLTLGFTRTSNHAGGIEGGMSNGQPIVVTAAMKPISTVLQGMPSVDLRTREPAPSQYERSDICAVPAASVVVENVVAFEVARALRTKFGGDSKREVAAQVKAFMELVR